MALPEDFKLPDNFGTTDRIGRRAFGSADWLKVQAQHEAFLKEIENLPHDKKVIELMNAAKYLLANKSDYWIEAGHLLHLLLGDRKEKGFYKDLEPNMTSKQFCESKEYLNMNYSTVSQYISVTKRYKDLGYSDHQLRALGFTQSRQLLINGVVSKYKSKYLTMSPEELAKISKSHTPKRKPSIYYLRLHWRRATENEKKQFKKEIA